MYEYDEYNPKKKDEYEETEQESIDYSADGMEDEPHVDGESIEMEAEVISGEEYTEEISGEQFSEEEGFRLAFTIRTKSCIISREKISVLSKLWVLPYCRHV